MSEAALPESDTTRLVLAQAKALQDLKKMKSSLDSTQYQDAVERISKSYKKMIQAAEANDECRKLEAKQQIWVPKGHVVVFRGDVWHGGGPHFSAYPRAHAYAVEPNFVIQDAIFA